MDGADGRTGQAGRYGLHAPIRLSKYVFEPILWPKPTHGRSEGQVERDEVDEVALPVDTCLGVVSLRSDESG